MKRITIDGEESYYHCSSVTVHEKGLLDEEARAVFVKILGKVAGFCGVTVVTYCVMDNHFHLLVKVPEEVRREGVSDEELLRRYRLLYGDGRTRFMPVSAVALAKILAEDGEAAEQWRQALRARMYDLAMFMKLLKQRFSKWYNATRQAKGTLWTERYSSTLLEPEGAVLRQVACMIDLNAVSLGVVAHPQDYPWCGFAVARSGGVRQEALLVELMPHARMQKGRSLLRYEAMLYQYGKLEPKPTRRKMLEGYLNDKLVKPSEIPEMRYFSHLNGTREVLAAVAASVILGSYIFVEVNAQWIAQRLGRKKRGCCYQLGEGQWTLNRRLGM